MSRRRADGRKTLLIAVLALGIGFAMPFFLGDRFPLLGEIRDAIVERVGVLSTQKQIPPAVPPVSDAFAEQCAKLIQHDVGNDADACSASTCRAGILEADSPCKGFCQNFNELLQPKSRMAALDCQFSRNRRYASSESEVTGGRRDTQQLYPSTISIVQPATANAPRKICSGVLIAPTVALTAAHCVTEGAAQAGSRAQFQSELSDAAISSAPQIEKAIPMDGPDAVDLAIVSISEPFPLTAVAQLASSATIGNYPIMRVVGFGFDKQGNLGDRRWADVAIATRDCTGTEVVSGKPYRELYGCTEGREVVAGRLARLSGESSPSGSAGDSDAETVAAMSQSDNDTCKGDSGGAAYVVGAEISSIANVEERNDKFNADIVDNSKRWVLGITNEAVDTDAVPATKIQLPGGTEVKCGNGGRYVNVTEPKTRAWIVEQAALMGFVISP